MNKKISLLHPSWGRPQLAKKCYDEWMGKSISKENIEYILCLSLKDPVIEEYKANFNDHDVFMVFIEDNGLVKQVNHAANVSNGDLIIAVSDDFGCPDKWDQQLTSLLDGNSDFAVKTQDGLQPWIMTLPMMDRVYYQRFNYIYHPAYTHMWGDTENAHVADMLGKSINLPLLFPHRHYVTGINRKDKVNIENDKSMLSGEKIYLERLKVNFGIENPLPVKLPQQFVQHFIRKRIKI